MRKKFFASVIVMLALAASIFGQGSAGPIPGKGYKTFSGPMAEPWVTWPATGLILTYGQGSLVPPASTTAVTIVPTTSFAVTSVGTSNGIYAGTFTGCANNGCVGNSFNVAGFVTNAANNGLFEVTASTATALTTTNSSSVSESATATAASNGTLTVGSSATNYVYWNGTAKLLAVAATQGTVENASWLYTVVATTVITSVTPYSSMLTSTAGAGFVNCGTSLSCAAPVGYVPKHVVFSGFTGGGATTQFTNLPFTSVNSVTCSIVDSAHPTYTWTWAPSSSGATVTITPSTSDTTTTIFVECDGY